MKGTNRMADRELTEQEDGAWCAACEREAAKLQAACAEGK
jgi:hypothetical protein